jgi:protein TonB
MAYANAQSPNRRAAILGTVAAIHVLAGYALVTGLASRFVPEVVTIFRGDNIPAPKPTPSPQPRPPRADPAAHRDPKVIDPPYPPPLPPLPQGPIKFTDTTGAAGGDIGTVEFPIDPPPPPAFTPRGPKPRGSEANWVSANDYPTGDLRQDHEGLTRVRLNVGTNGRVTRCEITATSGWPGLDKASCDRLSARARFDPATDHTGAQVEGSYATAVRWRIPEE